MSEKALYKDSLLLHSMWSPMTYIILMDNDHP